MASDRITIRLGQLRKKLARIARQEGRSESEVVREMVEGQIKARTQESCYDIAKRLGIIGIAKNLPSDISTNPKYFEGFGKHS